MFKFDEYDLESRFGNTYDRFDEDEKRGKRLDRDSREDNSAAVGNRIYKKPAVSSATNKLPRPKNIKVCFYCNLNIYLPFNCTIIASV